MAEYGVTDNGFVIKRQQQIITELNNAFNAVFPGVDTDPESPTGQLIGVFSQPQAEAWENAAAVYNSQYPNTANGVSLDYVAELNAVTRLGKRNSFVYIAMRGTEGTIIPITFIGETITTQYKYKPVAEKTITINSAIKATIDITTVVDSTDYTLTINTTNVIVNSGIGATRESIALLFHNEINAITDVLGINSTLPSPQDGSFVIESNNLIISFAPSVDSNMDILEFWTPVYSVSLDQGNITAPAGTLTQIVTSIFGLNEITNFLDADPGSDIENDPEFKIRRYNEIRGLGGATVEAIRDRLAKVDDVIDVKVFENDGITTDGAGRPPKSVQAVVAGGTNEDIANEYWLVKGGGIKTFGAIAEVITDSQGDNHIINFDRPTDVFIWLKYTLTVNGDYPDNGDNLIKNGTLETAQQFGIGDDVIVQEFYCPIYAVPGVISATIEIARTLTLTPPVSYVTTNIAIAATEVPLFDTTRIDIIIP